MKGDYLGHLPGHDPLSGYLKNCIFPQLGSQCRDGIRVFRTNGSNAVYIYEDRETNHCVVGKFFYSDRMPDWERAFRRLNREYHSIVTFRALLDSRPDMIVLVPVHYFAGSGISLASFEMLFTETVDRIHERNIPILIVCCAPPAGHREKNFFDTVKQICDRRSLNFRLISEPSAP